MLHGLVNNAAKSKDVFKN